MKKMSRLYGGPYSDLLNPLTGKAAFINFRREFHFEQAISFNGKSRSKKKKIISTKADFFEMGLFN